MLPLHADMEYTFIALELNTVLLSPLCGSATNKENLASMCLGILSFFGWYVLAGNFGPTPPQHVTCNP